MGMKKDKSYCELNEDMCGEPWIVKVVAGFAFILFITSIYFGLKFVESVL